MGDQLRISTELEPRLGEDDRVNLALARAYAVLLRAAERAAQTGDRADGEQGSQHELVADDSHEADGD